ncbi:hypothetical protein [Bacteroides heparinolyticus]|uniref:hypothetical protein n=1 Tax=Prevotella heparinolytica TaxID=28113 RepID=UPI0035A16A4C
MRNSPFRLLFMLAKRNKYLSSGQAVPFAKDQGCILSDGYFLNAPVYSGRAEENFYADLPSPSLFDSCKPLS